MPRFFVTPEDIEENSIKIVGDDARHIARSLRMAVGDGITVADGEGGIFSCRLTHIRDELCECEIISKKEPEDTPRVTLFMGYPKGDKLELVIQKAVELGASRIVPFESSRCIRRPKAEREEKQTERLRKIAAEAAKQCGVDRLPELSRPIPFDKMLEEACASELSLFCYENEDRLFIGDALPAEPPRSISVIVGPEGGFSEEEANRAICAGCASVSLGGRILRCETAPLFAISVISAKFRI